MRSAFRWEQKGEDEHARVAQDGYLHMEVRQMQGVANPDDNPIHPYLLVSATLERRGWWDPCGSLVTRIPGGFIPDGIRKAEEFARLLRKFG